MLDQLPRMQNMKAFLMSHHLHEPETDWVYSTTITTFKIHIILKNPKVYFNSLIIIGIG